MKKRFKIIYLASFILIIVGCSDKENLVMAEQYCPIKELLLNEIDYPSGSVFDVIDSPIYDKPIESAGQSAYYYDSWTDQTVIRYSSIESAIEEYKKTKNIVFNSDKIVGLWETPSILNLKNLSANNYEIACGNLIYFGNRCYIIGQYEEYYVFFRADISTEGINYELFKDLILKIDKEMAACLSK